MKEEAKQIIKKFKELDKDVVLIFLAVSVLNVISFYYTSRRFFRIEIQNFFLNDPLLQLYEFLYWFIGDFIVFFIIPVILILLVHKKKLGDFGIAQGDYKFGIKISFLVIIIFLPVLWVVSSFEAFAETQPHLSLTKYHWSVFLIYEIGMFIYMIGWEFIWRGYMLFGLERIFGYYAIFIQMIPFVILHNGKPELETFSAILGGIALGYIALRTRSFIYCVIIHFSVMFSIDIISVVRYRTDIYGIGFNSIVQIIRKLLL